LLLVMGVDNLVRRATAERRMAYQCSVERDAQRIEITPSVGQARIAGLLGRHVLRRSQRRAARGQAALLGPQHPKIEQRADTVSADHDISRLDVPMNEASSVNRAQRVRDLAPDLRDRPQRQRTVCTDQLRQRSTRDPVHHEVRPAEDLAARVYADQTGVLDPREHLRFERKARTKLGVRPELLQQHLHRDRARPLSVPPFVHFTHAPPRHERATHEARIEEDLILSGLASRGRV